MRTSHGSVESYCSKKIKYRLSDSEAHLLEKFIKEEHNYYTIEYYNNEKMQGNPKLFLPPWSFKVKHQMIQSESEYNNKE